MIAGGRTKGGGLWKSDVDKYKRCLMFGENFAG
jgi:hypothetical protein